MTDFLYLFLYDPMFLLRYYLKVSQEKVMEWKDCLAAKLHAGSLQG